MASEKTYRPGEKVPCSGQYGVYNPLGEYQGYEVTAVKGEPFPPSPKPHWHYRLHDASERPAGER